MNITERMERDRLKRDLAHCQFNLLHLEVVIKDTIAWLEEAHLSKDRPDFKAAAEKLRKEIPK